MGKPRGAPPQTKINVTSKSPVGDISVVTLIRTDTTLDHSQKAEKVCSQMLRWRDALIQEHAHAFSVPKVTTKETQAKGKDHKGRVKEHKQQVPDKNG